MKDIIVYTTPDVLLHKQGKLLGDDDYSETGDYYWQLPSIPKHEIGKIYFATKGFIRGYFVVEGDDIDRIDFNSRTWKEITPIPQKPFQGFKYYKESEAIDDE